MQSVDAEFVDTLYAWAANPPRPARHLVGAVRVLAGRLSAALARPTWKPLGALDRVRREIHAGTRRFGQSDALGMAAVWETVARERYDAGDYLGAGEALERGAGALLDADEERAPIASTAPARAGRSTPRAAA